MDRDKRMPAGVFWSPVLWMFLVVSAVMWVGFGLEAETRITKRNTFNANARFQQSLFRHIAETNEGTADNPAIASIAAFLREQSGNLDEIVKRERLISSSLTKEQRTMLYVQNPERFPEPLLLMSNASEWHALRNDAVALDTLKKLLSGETREVPDAKYDTSPNVPTGFLIAWLLVCQFIAFLAYLINWDAGDKNGYRFFDEYRWYEVGIPTRLCMILLLPGAAPILAPMALVAITRHMKKQWHGGGRDARQQGMGLSSAPWRKNNSKDFLKKLQQRADRRMEGNDAGSLRK